MKNLKNTQKSPKVTIIKLKRSNLFLKLVISLLTSEDDQERQTPLKIIIESLKEEQEHQLDLIEDHYEKLFEQCYNQFKTQARTNSGIQLIEEKLRLEIYNQINNIVNPKK